MLSFAFVYAASTVGLFFVVLTSVIVYIATKNVENADIPLHKMIEAADSFGASQNESSFGGNGFRRSVSAENDELERLDTFHYSISVKPVWTFM